MCTQRDCVRGMGLHKRELEEGGGNGVAEVAGCPRAKQEGRRMVNLTGVGHGFDEQGACG